MLLNKNPISHLEVNSYYASKNSKIETSKFQNIGARSYTIDNIENEPNFVETKKVQKSQQKYESILCIQIKK